MSSRVVSRLAAKILFWEVILLILVAALFVFITISFEVRKEFVGLLLLPFFFLVYFLALQRVLSRAQREKLVWGYKEDKPVTLSGPCFLGLAWGLLWRSFILGALGNIFSQTIGNVFEFASGASIDIVQAFITVGSAYLAIYWLLRYQFGSLSLSYQEPTESLTSQIGDEAQPITEDESRPGEAVNSGAAAILTTVAVIGYLGVGLLQLMAIYGFFSDYWGWWAVPSFMAALFIAYIPILGSIAGTITASKVWGWEWYFAALLFFWPFLLMFFATGVAGIAALVSGLFRGKSNDRVS